MRIALVTGSRSDWRLIEPLLVVARDGGWITTRLLVTGSHLSARHGHTVDHIRRTGWQPSASVAILEEHDTPSAIARATGRAVGGLAEALAADAPDWAVVVGDRYESFAAGVAATMLGIPLAHIGGGETDVATNQDCNLRNALTKLAQVHCVAHELAASRLRALGEEAHRIYVTGLPSIDSFRDPAGEAAPLAPGEVDLIASAAPFILASFLPVTLRPDESRAHLRAMLAALEKFDRTRIIFVLSNGDATGDAHDEAIRAWAASWPNVTLTTDLSSPVYQRALRCCACYVGNSSSGVIETPVYGTPAVIVGSRQDGRPRAQNVRDVPHPTAATLTAKIDEQMRHGPYVGSVSPWGDGRSAARILAVLHTARSAADLMSKRLILPTTAAPRGVVRSLGSEAIACELSV